MTNVGRHAQAAEASVFLGVASGQCRLQVTDNGCGLDVSASEGGFGLLSLRRRAEKLRGRYAIETSETGATSLIWQVPVTS